MVNIFATMNTVVNMRHLQRNDPKHFVSGLSEQLYLLRENR